MKLSVIIPIYNEAATCSLLIEKVKLIPIQKQIIVVDDCSTDGSGGILKGIGDIELIRHQVNRGKGSAVQTALTHLKGDFVVLQDGDLEYDPSDYNKLIKPIEKGVADVVYGSRFLGGEEKRVLYFWHTLGNKFLTTLSNMFSNLNLTDMEVGYKLFKSNVIKDINLLEDRFGFEPEVTAKIAKKKIRIFEVGISYYGRKYEDGKKITWKDGISAIRCIFKYNLFD